MSIFIIYSSYNVIILERLPIIGIFRSIGAIQKAVTHILLLESQFYGCMGGLIGILVGIFVLKAILQGIGIVLFVVSVFLPHLASGNTGFSGSQSGSDDMLYLAGGVSLLGLIAARNMKDNKNIAQSITLLFISIYAIIAISVICNFETTYISNVFHGAELQGFADGRMEPEFVERVGKMEGIQKLLPVYVFENTIKTGGITFPA